MFDWRSFLDKYGVDWAESGPNISHGNIGVKCPFCGHSDPSHHLGINPETGAWNCWRDPTHRGRTPYYLIQKIARCSKSQAVQLYDGGLRAGKIDLDEIRRSLDSSKETKTRYNSVSFSEHEFLLTEGKRKSFRFYKYLTQRGFTDCEEVAEQYKLRGAISGNYSNRIIFPIVVHGKLVGWTGRALGQSFARYKTAPSGEQVGRTVLYNLDQASYGGRKLVVCEGPFDSLKVDYFGKRHGIRSVALLGLSLTNEKANLLLEIANKFSKIQILLDEGAYSSAVSICDRLVAMNASIVAIPDGVKDPGEMSREQVLSVLG